MEPRSTAAGHGNGIRYKYGLFEQKIINNEQVEVADIWLKNGYPFEIVKPDKAVVVKYNGDVRMEEVNGKMQFIHENYDPRAASSTSSMEFCWIFPFISSLATMASLVC